MSYKRPSSGRTDSNKADQIALEKTVVPWGVELAASILCKRWKPGIIWLLLDGGRRFGQLADGMPGVSAKMLTQQLRELERDGLVARTTSRPPVYRLTKIGRKLSRVIIEWEEWAVEYLEVSPGSLARYGLMHLFNESRTDATPNGSDAGHRAD